MEEGKGEKDQGGLDTSERERKFEGKKGGGERGCV